MYTYQHNYDVACRYYELMMATNPSLQSVYGSAICALLEDYPERAIELLSTLDPGAALVSYYLGIAYYRTGDYDRAVKCFLNTPEGDRSAQYARFYLGLLMMKQQKLAEAVEYFNQAPEVGDKRLLIKFMSEYSQLANARDMYIAGEYDTAVVLYNSITHFPGYRELGLAFSYTKLNAYAQSLAYCDSVIQLSDDTKLTLPALSIAADVCIVNKDYPCARSYLKTYLLTAQTDDIIFKLGKTYSDEARYDSAQLYLMGLPDTIDAYLFFKGRTDYFLGHWGRAEEYLLRHREFFSQSPYGDRATFIIASINFKRKEYGQAISFWTDLVNLYPQSVYTAIALKGIGDAYYQMGNYGNALDAYYQVKAHTPSPATEAQTTLRIYETRFYLGHYPSLLEALRAFIEEHSNSSLVKMTHMRIAQMLFDSKAYYQSLAECNYIIDNYPQTSFAYKSYIQNAQIYKILGNMQEVKKIYHTLMSDGAAREYHLYAADELAVIYTDESQYDSSLYYYNMLLDNADYQEKALYEIARTYRLLGQDNEAETMVDKLVNDFPNSIFLFDALMMKTHIYKAQGKYEKALFVLRDLLKNTGTKPEIYVEIGNVYSDLEDFTNARKNYLIACEHFKQRRDEAARALMLAGDASSQLGDREGAREYYLQAELIAMSPLLKNEATKKLSNVTEDQ
jgi:tetratricopeptide (TPR) repeat protein